LKLLAYCLKPEAKKKPLRGKWLFDILERANYFFSSVFFSSSFFAPSLEQQDFPSAFPSFEQQDLPSALAPSFEQPSWFSPVPCVVPSALAPSFEQEDEPFEQQDLPSPDLHASLEHSSFFTVSFEAFSVFAFVVAGLVSVCALAATPKKATITINANNFFM
jgi:hypothetical protein